MSEIIILAAIYATLGALGLVIVVGSVWILWESDALWLLALLRQSLRSREQS